MRHRKITLQLINALTVNTTVWDGDLKGFCARRQKGTTVTYQVKVRIAGKIRWITIGHHGAATPDGSSWTPETARRAALKILANPTVAVIPAPPAPVVTFAAVAELFLTKHGPKLRPRTLVEYRHMVDHYLVPALGDKAITTVTRADVSSAHASWAKHPRRANFGLTVLSKFMSWCENEGHRPEGTNPVRKVERYEEGTRERYLTTSELQKLGAALDRAEREHLVSPFAIAAIRLLILTGARLSEILTLEWSFVDLERTMLFLPRVKEGGTKGIPLNSAAVEVIKGIPKLAANPFVIVGKNTGDHMKNLHKPWTVVRDLAKLHNVRIHDIRHTHASIAVASGGSLPVIGKILGHSNPSTTQRYAHLAGDSDPVRKLTETTGQIIAQAMAPKPTRPSDP